MPIPVGVLIGMQAAGMVIDYLGKDDQIEMAKRGEQLEQERIQRDIQTTRLEAEDASLQAMKNLRRNLGTQAVMLAARGTRGSAGSALTFSQESISNAKSDERTRRINQLGREASLRAGSKLAELHQKAFEQKTWGDFTTSIVNKIPTDPNAWSSIFGK